MKTEIRTRAWVRVGNESVDVDTLSPEMKRALAEKLALTYFNTLYAGRAVFSPGEDKDGKTNYPSVSCADSSPDKGSQGTVRIFGA